MRLDLMPVCIFFSGIIKRRHQGSKLVHKYDGKKRMSTPHGCLWSAGRVSSYATKTSINFFPFCTLILTLNFFFCRFTVEADEPIEALTIIAEYVGDVDYLKNREDDEGNNSMMTLLYASDRSQSLIICPDKRSNISRFISGINNHTRYVSIIFKFYSLHMLES